MTKTPIALEDRNVQGKRRFSPSSGRNKGLIAEKMNALLKPEAHILEVASGTGEHGHAISRLRDDVSWQYSDPDFASRESQDDWRKEYPMQLRPSLPLDMTAPEWWGGMPTYDAVFSANMIHIAPIEACYGLALGAAHLLNAGGQIFLYGPFLYGEASKPSNLEFDRNLKARNSTWGVREQEFVKHIFAKAGFNQTSLIAMPKNNHLCVFTRD